MTLNCDFGEPYDINNPDDLTAVENKVQFMLGWFANPIVNGDYPDVMKAQSGGRMPAFTPDEVTLIKGSYDFFGLNHYTTTYTRLNKDMKNQDWISDRLIEETFVNATGH